ncbi:PASTA domain-containing protein [Sedimentibacter sp.]|nr:PASTA domain-containing protein [Sedimentibacter sp.]
MPGVTDLPLDAAKAYIIQYGLIVGEVTPEPSDTVEEGFVINQSVPAGQDVALGTTIWLTVSSGKPDTEDPGTEEPGDGDGEEPGGSGTYPLTISLPKNKDEVYIVVQRIAEGGREIVYSNDVDTSEQSIIINVEGTGTQVFEIYIDNELYDKVEIKFE